VLTEGIAALNGWVGFVGDVTMQLATQQAKPCPWWSQWFAQGALVDPAPASATRRAAWAWA
jgi:hypothetical protein